MELHLRTLTRSKKARVRNLPRGSHARLQQVGSVFEELTVSGLVHPQHPYYDSLEKLREALVEKLEINFGREFEVTYLPVRITVVYLESFPAYLHPIKAIAKPKINDSSYVTAPNTAFEFYVYPEKLETKFLLAKKLTLEARLKQDTGYTNSITLGIRSNLVDTSISVTPTDSWQNYQLSVVKTGTLKWIDFYLKGIVAPTIKCSRLILKVLYELKDQDYSLVGLRFVERGGLPEEREFEATLVREL